MKKFLALILALLLVLSLVGCGNDVGNEGDGAENSSVEAVGNEVTGLEGEIVVNTDEYAISYKIGSIEEDYYDYLLMFENKSDVGKDFQLDGLFLDGVWARDTSGNNFFCNVPPKGIGEIPLVLYDDFHKELGICGTDIEVIIAIYLEKTLDDERLERFHIYPFGEEPATIFEREMQPTDIVLVDSEDVSLIVTGYGDENYPDDITVSLLLENWKDNDIWIDVESVYVNDILCGAIVGEKFIHAGGVTFNSFRFYDGFNSLADVEIEEIVFTLQIGNENNSTPFIEDTITLKP